MFETNTAALTKLAQLFAATPDRDPWHTEKFTGNFSAMEGRLRVSVGRDFVRVEECADNGYGYMLAFRAAVVPSGLSYVQIVEWVRAWIDNKPTLPDGDYRISAREIYRAPAELTSEQTNYLMSFVCVKLGAYPLGGHLTFNDSQCVSVGGNF